MTLPDERYRAVMWASRFLQELAYDREKYPRISKTVRQEANSILRHYPSSFDLKQASHYAPNVFQERMEPLYRMVKQHDENLTKDIKMNVDIKELMKEAGTDTSGKWMSVDNAEKFAELIVRECIAVHKDNYGVDIIGDVLKKHFGVKE